MAGITTDEYFKLRLDELGLVARFHPVSLDTIRLGSEIFPLWQRIRWGGGYRDPTLH